MGTTDLKLLELVFKHTDIEVLKARDSSVTEVRLEGLLESLKEKLSSPGGEVEDGLILYTDGTSRGNPGEAGIGVVLKNKANKTIEEVGQFIGETTNNVAEYRALVEGLKRALARGTKGVEIFSDSELLVRQINGEYRVKSASLLPLYQEAMEILNGLSRWKIVHIPREKNARADALANMAIDSQKTRLKS
jgi:ribonuclease HI